MPKDTAQGTVQRYLTAIQDQDYLNAYSYLYFGPTDKTTTYDDWIQSCSVCMTSQSVWEATLGEIVQNGEDASVKITIGIFHVGASFEDQSDSLQMVFLLSKIENTWLITSPTYVYWIY